MPLTADNLVAEPWMTEQTTASSPPALPSAYPPDDGFGFIDDDTFTAAKAWSANDGGACCVNCAKGMPCEGGCDGNCGGGGGGGCGKSSCGKTRRKSRRATSAGPGMPGGFGLGFGPSAGGAGLSFLSGPGGGYSSPGDQVPPDVPGCCEFPNEPPGVIFDPHASQGPLAMKSEDLQFNEMACIAAGGDWHPENNPERCLTVEPAEKCCCCVEDIKLVKVETRDKTKPGQRRDGHYFEGKIHLEFHGDTIPGCNCVPHWLEEVKKGREPRYFRLARRFIRKYSNTTQGGQLIMVGNNLNVAALVRAAQEQIKTTKESKRTPDRLLSAIAKYNNSNSIGPLLNWSKQCRPGKRVVFPFSDTPAIAWAVARTMYIAVGMDSCGCPPACRCNNRYVLLELRQTLKPGVLALEEKKTMKNCKGKVSEGKWQQIKIKQDCNR